MTKSLVILFVLAAFQVDAQKSIEGIWLTQEGNSKVEIYQNGEAYFGKIVWLEKSVDSKGNPLTDRNNSNKALRNRQLVGIDMLQDIQNKNDKWLGKIYAPKRGLMMDVVIEAKEENKLELNISYQGFTRQQIWIRSTQ